MFTIRFGSLFRSPVASRRGSTLERLSRWVSTFVQVAALCASIGTAGAAPPAEKLTVADRRAIEHTIRMQLDAFGRDDADSAFAIATPDIQRMFGSSDAFMRMVRDNYEPVYRPSSVRFIRVEQSDGRWVQTVQITDENGKVWRALFTMRRQVDKGWKVGGCQLVETSAIET
jgi:hypothetical protein